MTAAVADPPPVAQRPRTTRWIAAAAAVVAVAFLLVLATRPSAQSTAAASPLLGKPAPEVIGKGLEGETIRLSQFRGRYVLLNFFATWCVPCLREHDDLIRFQERHMANDATVLAVIFDDEVGNVRKFFAERGGSWPVIADERGKVSLDFGVRGPPESFLIDPDGVVVSRIIGEVDDGRLEKLLGTAEALR